MALMFSSIWGFEVFVPIATDLAVMEKSVYFVKVGVGFLCMTFVEQVFSVYEFDFALSDE